MFSGRLSSMDVEKGKKESKNGLMGVKKIQKKETKPATQDVMQPVPQLAMTTASSIQAEPSPTGCCRCFKKKRKKTRKKHKR